MCHFLGPVPKLRTPSDSWSWQPFSRSQTLLYSVASLLFGIPCISKRVMATLKKSFLGGVCHLHRPPFSQVFTYSLFDERVESVKGVLLSARLNRPSVNDLVSTVCGRLFDVTLAAKRQQRRVSSSSKRFKV